MQYVYLEDSFKISTVGCCYIINHRSHILLNLLYIVSLTDKAWLLCLIFRYMYVDIHSTGQIVKLIKMR